MDKKIFTEKLIEAFTKNGLQDEISPESAEKLYCFSRKLIEANERFNLTAIKDDNGIILKHFTDCATVLKHIPQNSKLVDVGCGAGFPSLPIAILRPDVAVTALDSTAKKIDFINQTASELGLVNIEGVSARAEDFAKNNKDKFDIAISRAVARLNILDELCIPLLKKGGKFIAMKSSRGEEEYAEAKSGIEKLGATFESKSTAILEYAEEEIEREIFIFVKRKETPAQYPRNYSQISKKPL